MTLKPSQIIREARKKIDKNQEDFAKYIGKTQSVLSRYETGQVKPSADIIMHCMNILNSDSSTDDIEQIIAKIRTLDGEQHLQIRRALSLLLDKCISPI